MKKLIAILLGLTFSVALTLNAFGADGDPILLPGDTDITTVGTIASGTWEGTVVDATRGGTGVADPTDHSILLGSGSGPVTPLTVGTNGLLLLGVTTADPAWSVSTFVEGANDFIITKGTAILNVDAPLQITGTGAIITGVDQANTLSMSENLTVSGGAAVVLAAVDQANTFTMNESFTIGGGFAGTLTYGAAVVLTINGQDITLAGVDAGRTLTMNEDLVIGGGFNGTLTYSADAKVLTVEDSATVSQDYSSDASPEFADLTLSGGDITLGAAATAYAGKITLHDADAVDGNTASIQSHADLGASYTLTLPVDDGENLEVLQTNGSGVLAWAEMTVSPTWGAIASKTVVTGVITTGSSFFMAITEEGDAADAVTSIDGAAVGDVIVLKGVAALNNTITFTDDNTNLDLQANFLMDNQNDTLVLICIGVGTPDTFIEVSRASNG